MWRLHRKEPGCVVGEHMHVFFWKEEEIGWWFFFETEIDRFGEIDLSIEKRKEGVDRDGDV